MARKATKATKAPNMNTLPAGKGAANLLTLSSQFESPRRGTRELLKLYSESPWLRAIVGKIARAVAEVEWCLYVKPTANGGYAAPTNFSGKNVEKRLKAIGRATDTGELVEVETHPLLDMLERGTGNVRLTGFGVFQVTQEHLDLAGEAYWLIERDGLGVPYAIWPVPPSWVASLPTAKNPYYQITGTGGLQVQVPITEVVPFIDIDPYNPYGRGSGISHSLDDDLQIDEYSSKHMKMFFLNRARPDLIISGQFMSEKDTTRLEQQWLSDHQGFWKGFKPLFFSQKIDVKELTQTFESMQMTQLRKAERDTFVSVFGVPPEKLGIIGDSKRSTIAAADAFWQKDVLRPRLETMRRSIQGTLVPMFDPRLLIQYETPVIQENEYELDVLKAAPWTATVNEWRKRHGEKSLGPTGDVLVVPLNMQMIPVTTENGEPVSQDETVENNLRAIRARGNVPEVEIETNRISDGVAKSVVDAIGEALGDFKKELRREVVVPKARPRANPQ